jgi:hypothetical protein
MAKPERPELVACANRETAQGEHRHLRGGDHLQEIFQSSKNGDLLVYPTLQALFALAGRTGRFAAEPGTGQGADYLQRF